MMKRLSFFALMCLAVLVFTSTVIAQTATPADEIWQPKPGTTWQIQLTGEINTSWNVEMYVIDLFDAPQETIDLLKSQGRAVVCYFSAGSYEDWRPDAEDFPQTVLGEPLDGWPGEWWLDIRALDLLAPIMEARLALAVSKGCDGVDPDNVNGYTNPTGFDLTYEDQVTYNTWLAAEAHERGLAIGLKNDLEQIGDLVDDFDWQLNEQCFYYNECDLLLPFIEAGKAVFGIEYEGDARAYCRALTKLGYSWLTKTYNLDDEPPGACSDTILPLKPKQITPEKDVQNVPTAPVFSWKGGNAAAYRLKIQTLAGRTIFNRKFTHSAVCDGWNCAFDTSTASLKLKKKWYRWRIVAKNKVGVRPSTWRNFKVQPG